MWMCLILRLEIVFMEFTSKTLCLHGINWCAIDASTCPCFRKKGFWIFLLCMVILPTIDFDCLLNHICFYNYTDIYLFEAFHPFIPFHPSHSTFLGLTSNKRPWIIILCLFSLKRKWFILIMLKRWLQSKCDDI